MGATGWRPRRTPRSGAQRSRRGPGTFNINHRFTITSTICKRTNLASTFPLRPWSRSSPSSSASQGALWFQRGWRCSVGAVYVLPKRFTLVSIIKFPLSVPFSVYVYVLQVNLCSINPLNPFQGQIRKNRLCFSEPPTATGTWRVPNFEDSREEYVDSTKSPAEEPNLSTKLI